MKIFIVEDDIIMAQTLQNILKKKYAVDVAHTGLDALKIIKKNPHDLYILDIHLPDKDGIEICRQIRNLKIFSPIIMLTGEESIDSKTKALDCGSDDYLTKPFHAEELLSRVNALLRRPPQYLDDQLIIGDLSMNLVTRKVMRGKREIDLKKKEFELLEYFMRNPDKILTRDQILHHVWQSKSEVNSNTVDVHIKMLRDKVDQDNKYKRLIYTSKGIGYKINKQ